MLEGVVFEGHGDRLKEKVEYFTNEESAGSINYISETVPKIMNKIRVIHAAVSCGDLIGLQDNLEKKDYVLSKDHLGMAPLHKATIMGHIDVVQYILEKFPETINAKDKEGRTALHYAAATTNRNGSKIYRMLIRAGADPRLRDSVNLFFIFFF
jgi:ankyrin repeat protein